jgi:Protein of unknown function (DUF4239)
MRVDSYLSGFLLIAMTTMAAIAGLLAVRKRIDSKMLKACHDVGSCLLSVVGTLYAVLLGLIVVDAMELFQEAHQTTVQEANALSDVVLLSRRLPQEQRRRITKLAKTYADLVVDKEWAEMDRGGYLPEARRTVLELIDEVVLFEPRTESEKTLHEAQVEAAIQIWNSRRCRTTLASQRIPALKWFVIILGGAVTVVFTFFFAVDNLKLQLLMTSLITIIISLNVFLVLMFGYPFSGELKVDPSSYRVAREISDTFPTTPTPLTEPRPGASSPPTAEPRNDGSK